MADYSLDDYIQKKGSRLSGRFGNRLGAKISPGKAAVGNWKKNTAGVKGRLGGGAGNKPVVVTGVGKIRGGFDARQKLGKKNQIQDARQRIQQNKVPDARLRLTNKKKTMGSGPANTRMTVATSPNDMRIKLNNALARKTDARQMIQARKQAKQQASGSGRQAGGPARNTGGTVSVGQSGSLTRTIPGSQGGAGLFQKTIQNQRMTGAQDHSNLISVRISNDPVAQAPRSSYGQSQSYQQSYQPPAYQQHMYPEQPSMPIIHVRNEMYQPQPPPPAPQPPPTAIHYQPAYQQHDYYQEDYTTSQSVAAATAAVKAAVKPRAPAKPTKSSSSSAVAAADIVSPLQGSSVLVTNLHPKVSEDDVVELFGVVGALKKAKLMKPGSAEVVFVKSEEAQAAIRKYHMRELDGQPMHVVMSGRGPVAPQPKRPTSPQIHQPLKLNKLDAKAASEKVIDPNLIHRALFKSTGKQDAPTKPVTFTVKI